ncbi:MAG: hypothetical protein AABY95_00110 [Pseudomonadota bacterium]
MKHLFALTALILIGACSRSEAPTQKSTTVAEVKATPQSVCGPGSRPETGIQGRVSREDHTSGRAAEGFSCNMKVVGSYVVETDSGNVGGFKVERYTDLAGHDCAYYDTTLVFPTNLFAGEAGVNVLDMSDPRQPTFTTRLTTPAMLSPHESLVLNKDRGLLVAVMGNPALFAGMVDVYDISQDCRYPVLQSVTPLGILGHESGFAPDGRTFYAASPGSYTVTAIDLTDPRVPKPLAVLPYSSHGLSISDDGNRMYIAGIGLSGSVRAFGGPGDVPDPNDDRALVILDVSQIQARVPNPQVKEISRLTWSPMSIPQNAIPFTRNGHPYLVEIDEYGREGEVGAARIIDIGDETKPVVISDLRLAVHNPENFDAIATDPGADGVGQGYAGHYCNVPTRVNPTIVACSMIVSGLRVFDIRDLKNPKEVAYFNAPVQPRANPFPPYIEASNFAMSSPAFVPERKEIWYTDGNNGFFALRVTNGAWQ